MKKCAIVAATILPVYKVIAPKAKPMPVAIIVQSHITLSRPPQCMRPKIIELGTKPKNGSKTPRNKASSPKLLASASRRQSLGLSGPSSLMKRSLSALATRERRSMSRSRTMTPAATTTPKPTQCIHGFGHGAKSGFWSAKKAIASDITNISAYSSSMGVREIFRSWR